MKGCIIKVLLFSSDDSLSMKVDALAEARDLIKYINNKEMSQMAAIFDESRKFSDEDLEDLQNKQNKLDGLLDILLTKEEQENCESVVKAIVDNVPKRKFVSYFLQIF